MIEGIGTLAVVLAGGPCALDPLAEKRLGLIAQTVARCAAILGSIREQGKLDDALRQAIEAVDRKARLENIYLPYKPKRRTKAQIAREAGLEPLADLLLAHPERDPRQAAGAFVSPEHKVADVDAALEGAGATGKGPAEQHASMGCSIKWRE